MHRDILIACLPCFVVLCAAMLVLRGVLAVGVASWDWRRLTQMHRCQRGGVQSLAFVLTMPVFIMVVLLIVQVSQLMIAQMVLHYAAFAGARSASVWLPAAVDDPTTELDDYAEVENRVSDSPSTSDGDYTTFEIAATSSQKLWKVRAAVLQALAPLAPSRDLGTQTQTVRSANIANHLPINGLPRRSITSSISLARLSIAACGVFSPVTATATFFHHSWAAPAWRIARPSSTRGAIRTST